MLQRGAKWVKTTVRSHLPRPSPPCLIEGQFSFEQDARQYPPAPLAGETKNATGEAADSGEIENSYDSAYEFFLEIKEQYLGG